MKKNGRKKILAGLLAALLIATPLMMEQPGQKAAPAMALVRASGRQLILDAGHGGEDGGAVSLTGVAESGINLAIVLKMDQLLGFYGVAPILLRETDISLHDPTAETLRQKKVSDLKNRVTAIEETANGVVVSIHQNTFPNGAYHGAQVFFREGSESQVLAKQVQQTISAGVDPNNKRTPTRIPDTVYLMKHITCPAILVECGFLSNAGEEAKLRSDSYQTQLALCITSAWLNWIENSENGGSQAQDGVV